MSDPLKFFLRHCHLLTPVWIQNSPNEPRTLAHFYQTDARWSVENNEYNVAEAGPRAAARLRPVFAAEDKDIFQK